MVCLGNICRSPLAEDILKSKLTKYFIYIDSAGTEDLNSEKKRNYRVIKITLNLLIDISFQKTLNFKNNDFSLFNRNLKSDFKLVFEPLNKAFKKIKPDLRFL